MPYGVTKQKIFDVSVELFFRKGYDAVSMNEIAAAVGISNAAIYRHFNKKEDILNDILTTFKRKLNGYLLNKEQVDRYIETDTTKQLLDRCIGRFTEEDTPFMANSYRIVYREYLNKELANEVILSQLHNETAKSIRYVLDTLVEHGKIPALDTWFFSMMWTQAMFSAAVIWINCYFNGMSFEKSVEEYNTIADRIVNMAMSGKVP